MMMMMMMMMMSVMMGDGDVMMTTMMIMAMMMMTMTMMTITIASLYGRLGGWLCAKKKKVGLEAQAVWPCSCGTDGFFRVVVEGSEIKVRVFAMQPARCR